MAPLCSDPRQIIITFNPARRQALLKVVDQITSYMISELETSTSELGSLDPDNDLDERDNAPSAEGSATPQTQHVRPQKPDQQPKRPTGKAARQAERIQKAALKHMSDWKREFMPKLEEIVNVKDTDEIKAERSARVEAKEKANASPAVKENDQIDFGGVKINMAEDIASIHMLYNPIETRFSSLPVDDRREALSCVLLLLLSTGKYSAHSRAMILYLASALELPQSFVNMEEAEIAKSLLESSKSDKNKEEAMSAEAEAAKRRDENKFSRFWKVGLASVAGATIIGVTGGLAAPLVAGALGSILGGVGLGGVASFIGIFWMNGALVGALFGAYGAKMTGEMMDKYAKEVEDFSFIPIADEIDQDSSQNEAKEHQQRRLRVTIGINGWLNSEDDVTKPWRVLNSETEVFALRYEIKTLLALGTALQDLVTSFAWKTLKMEIIKRTVLATLWAALWPLQILSAASNVDNPYNHANNRSRKAGQLLADALINKVPGERPVTLIGFSLGATVIHACLQSLAERHAFGLIDTVIIIGTPAPSDPAHWRTLRTVVSGKIFNVYSENDMILGWVYRMHSLAMGVAGLQAIEGVKGLENLDLSGSVSGHLRYATLTGEILRRCGFLGVNAGNEIEKDDVIRMKDEHAQGKLVDIEAAVNGDEKRATNSGSGKSLSDLDGLTMSSDSDPPPAYQPRKEEPEPKSPPLPRRPTEHQTPAPSQDVSPKPIHRRPVEAPSDASTLQNDRIVRPAPVTRRPVAPPSDDEDEEGYTPIVMHDLDD